MSDLLNFLPDARWPRFACDALWQSSFIGAVAWIGLRVARPRPALHAWLALLAIATCAVAPIASLAARRSGYGLLSPVAKSPPQAVALAAAPMEAITVSSDDHSAAVRQRPGPSEADERKLLSSRPFDFWTFAAVVWGLASAVCVLRFVKSGVAVIRLTKTAVPCHDEGVVAAARRAAKQFGIAPPAVLVGERLKSPALLSWGKPRLFIPNLPQHVSQDWFAVFCHELAHARRGDAWGRLLAELATIALPWQPFVWRLRRDYYEACEEACDDWAIACGADPFRLAESLTGWMHGVNHALTQSMAGVPSGLRRRIVRLVESSGQRNPRLGTAWVVAGGILAFAASAGIGAAQARNSADEPGARQAVQARVHQVELRDPSRDEAKADTAAVPIPPAYRIESSDVLFIEVDRLAPKSPYHMQPLDVLNVAVEGALPEAPINDRFTITIGGKLNLGPFYGGIPVAGLTEEEATEVITKHLRTVLTSPVVSVELVQFAGLQKVSGEHQVGPDGRITLGKYGGIYVAGLTLEEAKAAIDKHLARYLQAPDASVTVAAYSSNVCFVIFRGDKDLQDGIARDSVHRVALNGGDTVLDALSSVERLQIPRVVKVSLQRAAQSSDEPPVLEIDWPALASGTSMTTNYRLRAGDRIILDPEVGRRELFEQMR